MAGRHPVGNRSSSQAWLPGGQFGPDHPGSATHTCAWEDERKGRRERAVNEGRERQATEILDFAGSKWAGRLVLLAVLSGHPVGRNPIAQVSWGGG
jgi:hypothetical protein